MCQSRKYMITIGTQCCIFITKTSLNVTMANTEIIAVNYSSYDTTWHMLSLSITGMPIV